MSALRQKLLDQGHVDEATLAALERWVPYKGLSLVERLYRSGVVSDALLVDSLLALGASDGTADLVSALPPPAALGALSRAVAERHRAIALRVQRARLVVAMLDPSDTDAIEKLAFFSGLAVETRAVRPRVLFEALTKAYGVPFIAPEAGFLAVHGAPASTGSDAAPFDDSPRTNASNDTLPAPSPDQPKPVFFDKHASTPLGDPYVSPLARSVVIASSGGAWAAIEDSSPRTALSLASLRDTRPAQSPAVTPSDSIEKQLAEIRKTLPPHTAVEARDSLPPQVLRLLVPPLRSAILFLVRTNVAVGWDARGPTAGRDRIRDVLLPLSAPSTFATALKERRVVVGNPADPSTIERILWQHMNVEMPSSFAVMPILVGDAPHALLYIDVALGALDDDIVEGARQVGTTLADGLAPFVASGRLFSK